MVILVSFAVIVLLSVDDITISPLLGGCIETGYSQALNFSHTFINTLKSSRISLDHNKFDRLIMLVSSVVFGQIYDSSHNLILIMSMDIKCCEMIQVEMIVKLNSRMKF